MPRKKPEKKRHDISIRGTTLAGVKEHVEQYGGTVCGTVEQWVVERLDKVAPLSQRAEDCPSVTPGAWHGGSK